MTEYNLHIKIGLINNQNGTQDHLHKLLDQIIDNKSAIETLRTLLDSLAKDRDDH